MPRACVAHLEFSQLVLDEDADEVLVLLNVHPVVLLRVTLVLARRQLQLQPNVTFNV